MPGLPLDSHTAAIFEHATARFVLVDAEIRSLGERIYGAKVKGYHYDSSEGEQRVYLDRTIFFVPFYGKRTETDSPELLVWRKPDYTEDQNRLMDLIAEASALRHVLNYYEK